MPHGFIPASAAQDSVTVSTFEELKTALASADSSTEIVVSNAIGLTNALILTEKERPCVLPLPISGRRARYLIQDTAGQVFLLYQKVKLR